MKIKKKNKVFEMYILLKIFSYNKHIPAIAGHMQNISTPRSVFLPIGASPIRLIGYSAGRR